MSFGTKEAAQGFGFGRVRGRSGKPDQTSFEELQGFPGVPEKRRSGGELSGLDKKVERASREMKRGLWPE